MSLKTAQALQLHHDDHHHNTLRAQGEAWVQRDCAKFYWPLSRVHWAESLCKVLHWSVTVSRVQCSESLCKGLHRGVALSTGAGCTEQIACAKVYHLHRSVALSRVHTEKFHLLQRPLQRDWASKVVHSSLSTVHWALYVHWANLHIAVGRASTNLIACNALQLCEPMRNCAFMHFKCQIYFANIVINSHTPYNPLNTSTHFMDCTQTFLLCTRAMHCATKISAKCHTSACSPFQKCPKESH